MNSIVDARVSSELMSVSAVLSLVLIVLALALNAFMSAVNVPRVSSKDVVVAISDVISPLASNSFSSKISIFVLIVVRALDNGVNTLPTY